MQKRTERKPRTQPNYIKYKISFLNESVDIYFYHIVKKQLPKHYVLNLILYIFNTLELRFKPNS